MSKHIHSSGRQIDAHISTKAYREEEEEEEAE
jgi:hypothetical protein